MIRPVQLRAHECGHQGHVGWCADCQRRALEWWRRRERDAVLAAKAWKP